jgi:HSP20 family molecular chaperone IbpA
MARRDIDRLQGEIEELFADLWQVPRFAGLRHGFRPAADPHQLNLLIELAGVEPASIEIVVDEQALMISGDRARPRIGGQVYQQAEIEYGHFERLIPLGHDVAAGSASATYEAGMLSITLPIAKRTPRGRTVAIAVRRDG